VEISLNKMFKKSPKKFFKTRRLSEERTTHFLEKPEQEMFSPIKAIEEELSEMEGPSPFLEGKLSLF